MLGEYDFLSQGKEFKQILFSLLIMTMAKVEQFLMYESNLKRPRPLDDAKLWAGSCNANTNIKDDLTRISWDGTKEKSELQRLSGH